MRLADAGAKLLFTADGGTRRGKPVFIKQEADRAAAEVPTLKRMVVLKNTGVDVPMQAGRDVAWDDYVKGQPTELETARLEAEDLSMIIFTSGTTGRPKGTCHTHAGALATIAKELGYAFDVKSGDVFCWVTDIGWMMGPWMMIGVTHHGATFVTSDTPPQLPGSGSALEAGRGPRHHPPGHLAHGHPHAAHVQRRVGRWPRHAHASLPGFHGRAVGS